MFTKAYFNDNNRVSKLLYSNPDGEKGEIVVHNCVYNKYEAILVYDETGKLNHIKFFTIPEMENIITIYSEMLNFFKFNDASIIGSLVRGLMSYMVIYDEK